MQKSSIDSYIQAEELRKFIEKKVLEVIKNMVETGEPTKELLQTIARRTLTLIKPAMMLDELYRNAVKLDDNISELSPVVVAVMSVYETKYEKKALEQVNQLVKSNKFDEAQEVMKKVLQYKIIS